MRSPRGCHHCNRRCQSESHALTSAGQQCDFFERAINFFGREQQHGLQWSATEKHFCWSISSSTQAWQQYIPGKVLFSTFLECITIWFNQRHVVAFGEIVLSHLCFSSFHDWIPWVFQSSLMTDGMSCFSSIGTLLPKVGCTSILSISYTYTT